LRRQKNRKTPKGIPTKIPDLIGKKKKTTKKKRTTTTTTTTSSKSTKRRKISIDSEAIESVRAVIPNLDIRKARYYLRRTKSNVQNAINMILDRRKNKKDDEDDDFSSYSSDESDDEDIITTTTTTSSTRNKSKSGIEDDYNDDTYLDRIKGTTLTTQYHDISPSYRVPIELWSKLYDHQKIGVKWLMRLHNQGTGGILGDEMGLGKTLQIVTHVASLQASKLLISGVLIVCPATMMAFWMQQFHKWYPRTRVMIMHECSRVMRTGEAGKNQLIAKALREKGVLLCTYAAVRRSETLQHAPWHYVVLDEGHHIKNEDALVTKAVKAFQTPHRILLSGAPVRRTIICFFFLHVLTPTQKIYTGSEQSQGVVVFDGFRISRTIGHSRDV
jgi:DNA excision repair protein ERCC-6